MNQNYEKIKDIIDISIKNIFNITYFRKDSKFKTEDILEYYTKIYLFLQNDNDNIYGNFIYNYFNISLENHYKSILLKSINQKLLYKSENIFHELNYLFYQNHKSISIISKLIFRYLERFYIDMNNLDNLNELSTKIFLNIIYKPYKEKLIDEFIRKINIFRNSKFNDYNFKQIYNMFSFMKIFEIFNNKSILIIKLHKDTENYYKENINIPDNLNELIKKLDTYLEKEKKILNLFKNKDNKINLDLFLNYNMLINSLIIKHNFHLFNNKIFIHSIIDEEFFNHMNIQNYELNKQNPRSISIIQNLFLKIEEYDCFNNYILDYIKIRFDNLLNYHNDPKDFMESLLQNLTIIKQNIITKLLKNNQIIIKKLNKFICHFTKNTLEFGNIKISFIKLMVKYINIKLLKDDFINNEYLKTYFYIFTNLEQKDYFINLYSKYLEHRLLFKNLNIDNEIEIINNLKIFSSYSYCLTLQKKIQDYKNSKYLFKDHISEDKIFILTYDYWHKNIITECNLDENILKLQEKYSDTYIKDHPKKKIKWNNDLSTVTFKYNIQHNKKYIITLTLIEYTILKTLYTNNNKMNEKDISDKLNIDRINLNIYLKNLTRSNLISRNDELLEINKNFNSKKIRITLPIAMINKSKNEDQNQNLIVENRKDILESFIVRIMKSRRKLLFDLLIMEVKNANLLFKPTNIFIESTIDSLIKRDYLEIEMNNSEKYINYLS